MAGLNESKIPDEAVYQSNGVSNRLSSSYHTGFNAGIFAWVNFKRFAVQPALLYSTKGNALQATSVFSDYKNTSSTYNTFARIRLNYLELPINVYYIIPVKHARLYIGGGPYAALGLSGRVTGTQTQTTDSVTTTNPINGKITFGSTGYRSFDYGLNASGCVGLNNGLLLRINYGFGLENLYHVYAKGNNRSLNISLGYAFL